MSSKGRAIACVVAVITAIVLIFQNVSLSNRLSTLEQNVEYYGSYMRDGVNGIERFVREVYDEVQKASRLTYGESISVTSYLSDGLAEVELSFTLKEYEPDSEIYVHAMSYTDALSSVAVNNGEVATAQHIGGGTFRATLTLSAYESYAIGFENNGDTVTTGLLFPDYSLGDELLARFKTEIASSTEVDETTPDRTYKNSYYPFVLNYYDGNDLLKIKSISAQVVHLGNEVANVDLMPYLVDDGTVQTVAIGYSAEEHREYAASGTTTFGAITDSPISESTMEDGTLTLTLRIEDYLGVVYTQTGTYVNKYDKNSSGRIYSSGGSSDSGSLEISPLATSKSP